MQAFQELGLHESWAAALAAASITKPTAIQVQAIPVLLQQNSDFIGLAQTGTGKTIAYGLPILQHCNTAEPTTQFLVVAPTRELAVQIGEELKRFGKQQRGLRLLTVYGGAPIAGQLRSLRANAPHILVATPGRLLDLIRRKEVSLDTVNAVVLDEADEMLNMGFKEDVHEILKHTGDHPIWMFSATMPPAIRNITETFMTDPVVVSINATQRTNVNIEHRYAIVTRKNRNEALKRFLDHIPDVYGIVFCRTRVDTQEVADDLNRSGYRVEALHGDLSQAQRERVMNQFRKRALKMIVATDVAARGLDINDLTHVFHLGMAQDHESFAHRSGRTARAGKSGMSVLLLNPREESSMRRLEKTLKISVQPIEIPTLQQVQRGQLDLWVENLKKTKPAKGQMVESAMEQLMELSKEELIGKVLAQQLGGAPRGAEDDLNARSERSSSRERGERGVRGEGRKGRDRKPEGKRERTERGDRDWKSDRKSDRKADKQERPERKSRSKNNDDGTRYFINAGYADGLDPRTLVDFVAEQAGISRKQIERVSIKDRFAFFDVQGQEGKNIGRHFDGLEVNGRKLRVNRDDE